MFVHSMVDATALGDLSNAELTAYAGDLSRFIGSPPCRCVLGLHLVEFLTRSEREGSREAWQALPAQLRDSMDALLALAGSGDATVSIDLLDMHACAQSDACRRVAPALATLLASAFALLPERSVDSDVRAAQIPRTFFRGENARKLKPKKQYEIALLAPQIARLAARLGTTCVVDVGAGQGHLARTLAARFGLDVVGVEQQEHNSRMAQKAAERVDALWGDRLRRGTHGFAWKQAVAFQRARALRRAVAALRLGGSRRSPSSDAPALPVPAPAPRAPRTEIDVRVPRAAAEGSNTALAGTEAKDESAFVLPPVSVIGDLSNGTGKRSAPRRRRRGAKGRGAGAERSRATAAPLRAGSFRSVNLRIDRTTDLSVLRQLSVATGNDRCVVVGLHACGDLTVDILRLFARDSAQCEESRAIAGVCVVGCCYNGLSATSFPLSAALQHTSRNVVSLEHVMTRIALNLACHPKSPLASRAPIPAAPTGAADVAAALAAAPAGGLERMAARLRVVFSGTDAESVEQVAALYSRALLSYVFADVFPDVSAEPWRFRIATGAKDMSPFSHYFEVAVRDHVRRPLPPPGATGAYSAAALNAQYDGGAQDCARLGLLWALRLAIAPLIEALLIVDRLLFLREIDPAARLCTVFDPHRSPRNVAIAC